MAIAAFSNLNISVADGGTVPSLDYLSRKTYVNIGSGNILKVLWDTPIATDNAINSYIISILANTDSIGYQTVYRADIGDVNEFYLKSDMLNAIKKSFIVLRISVEAISKYGTDYGCHSNTVEVNVSRGGGTYTRVTEGYSKPIMKRALAFTKLGYNLLKDASGHVLKSADNKAIYVKTAVAQDTTMGWSLMQEFYAKTPISVALKDVDNKALVEATGAELHALSGNHEWQLSDISYEILTDANGEVITDINNSDIYIL